jgi:DNA modification methylase
LFFTAVDKNELLFEAVMSIKQLEVIYRSIDALILDPSNPRLHSRRQIRQIARSIETFGFNVPILVNAELKVIAGHGRVLASRELGTAEVPTISVDHLSQEKMRAYMIADNKLSSTSTWSDELLANHFMELSALDLNFSLDVTGFEIGEIDFLIEGQGKSQSTQHDSADDLREFVSGPSVCKLGDLWLLGRHRVFCGNSLDSASYKTLTEGELAHLIFTDPPYNVRIDGHASGLGRTKHREFAMASGEMGRSEFTDFLTRVCIHLKRSSRAGAIHYICMDWRHAGELLAAGNEIYPELKNICVWVKHNTGMGSFYRSQHELVFVFKTGGRSHRNNIQLGKHGRHRTNVWEYRAANDFGRSTDEGNLLQIHPTVKPVAMVADAILDCSNRSDLVLDPFLGSGTTLIAAERVGRRCFGIEIDPAYVDTIIRRWQAFSGDAARHAVTGQAFDKIGEVARHG